MNKFIYLQYPIKEDGKSNDGKLHRVEPQKLYEVSDGYYVLEYLEEDVKKSALLKEDNGEFKKIPLNKLSYKILPTYIFKGKKINLEDTKLPNKIDLITFEELKDFDLPLLKPLADKKCYDVERVELETQKPAEETPESEQIKEEIINKFKQAPESGKTSESKAHDIYVTIGPDFDILIQPTNYFTKAIFKFVKDNEDSIMLVKDPLPKNRETIGRLFDASKRREEYLEERITHSMDAIQYNSNKKSDFKIISHYYGGYNHMFNIHYVFVSDPELYNKFLDAKFVSLTAQKEDRTIDTDSCEKMVFFGNDKKPFAKQENTNKHLL